jgi:hypothetical protein
MKLKFGSLVVDGRGKIGGHVASKNRAGAYLRTKVTPVNPRSASQITVRARLGTLSIGWRGLTAAQRGSWNAAVGTWMKTDIFGDLRKPSGFNLYQRLNNNLAIVGIAALTLPPNPIAVSQLTLLTAAQVPAGATTLTFTATPTPALHNLVIKATMPLSQGKNFVKSEFRIVKFLAPATASPAVITTEYAAKFGGPGVAGQKVFFECFYIHSTTGQAGLPVQASAIVA